MTHGHELIVNRVNSLLNLLELDAPDPILERSAAMLVQSLTLLWPGLWTDLGKEMQKRLRNGAGLCSNCGETEIPALLTHHVDCRHCCDSFVSECQQNYGIDPYAPNPPDVEEIMVELTNLEAAKVNNLPADFTDALERMLEARTQETNDA